MEIKYEPYSVAYGADIEVFRNATLEIGGGLGANIGLTIICADNISIGRHTGCGRNVTIRDNNGEHFISIRGYKISSPVTIKEHVWLTESSTVMPGAEIRCHNLCSFGGFRSHTCFQYSERRSRRGGGEKYSLEGLDKKYLIYGIKRFYWQICFPIRRGRSCYF